MQSPDYAAALDLLPNASPNELLDVLQVAANPLRATDLCLYLVDFQGLVLQPVLSRDGGDQEDVAGSMAGRAFRGGEPIVAERTGGARMWVVVGERGERTGVLALTVPEATEAVVADCVRLGQFAGLLVQGFARATDRFHVRRRRRSMTLAAGMQWDLLPPLTVQGARALACGRLEPAYEIAGDAFDYAVNDDFLYGGLFDGMGHGVHSTLMIALAIGAYRHSRRAGEPIAAAYLAMDEALADQYGGEAFVTAAFARLRLDEGFLEWCTAGHPVPLLMRQDDGVPRHGGDSRL